MLEKEQIAAPERKKKRNSNYRMEGGQQKSGEKKRDIEKNNISVDSINFSVQ